MANILSGGKFPSDNITYGYQSLGEYCQAKLRENANKVLMVNYTTKEEITGAQLLSRCTKLARSLSAQGFGPGDIAAVCCANDSDFYYVMIACFLLGAAFEPLATNFADRELIHVLSLARPSIVFATSDSIEQITRIAGQTDFIKNVFVYDKDFGQSHTDDTDVDTLFTCEPQDIGSRTALILLSSGTTGMPKGVELTQMNVFVSFHVDYIRDSETYLSVTPLCHLVGCFFVIRWLVSGKQAILLPRYDTEMCLQIIQDYKISAQYLAHPHMLVFAKHPSVDNYDLSSLTFIVYGSAPLSEDIPRTIKQRIGVKVICQTYGMTEAMSLIAEPTTETISPNSIGKLRPGTLGKVVDINTGCALPAGQHGEMMFKTLTSLKGYINDPVATKAIFDEDGFMRAGDMGYYNKSGEWFYVERIKELIKYNNVNISPTEMESVISMLSGVGEVSVVGKPDDEAGELPMAFIIRNGEVTEDEIVSHLAEHLAAPKRLYGGIRFVDSLPKNNLGKIVRRKLMEL